MRVGIPLCIISLVNMGYLLIGGIANEGYFAGCFIGGVIIVLMESLYNNFANQKDQNSELSEGEKKC